MVSLTNAITASALYFMVPTCILFEIYMESSCIDNFHITLMKFIIRYTI